MVTASLTRRRIDGGAWLRRAALGASVVVSVARPADAQLARNTIPVDLGSGAISGTLPFDVPFFLSAPAPPTLRAVRLWVGSTRGGQLADWRADCRLLQPPLGGGMSGGSGRTDVDPFTRELSDSLTAAVKRVATAQFDESAARRTLVAKDSAWRNDPARPKADSARDRVVSAEENVESATVAVARAKTDAEVNSAREELKRAQDALSSAAALLKNDSNVKRDSLNAAAVATARADLARKHKNLAEAQRDSATLRLPSEPTFVWNRQGLDSVGTLILEVGPVEPNRDYTFCFHLVRDPTKDEAAEFTRKATAAVNKTVRGFAKREAESLEALDSIQLALIASLPSADSLVLVDNASIFRRGPAAPNASRDARYIERLNEVADFYARFSERLHGVRNEVETADNLRANVVNALHAMLGHKNTLRELGRVGQDTARFRDADSLLVAASTLARRLGFLPGGQRDSSFVSFVADGALTVDDVASRAVSRGLNADSSLAYVTPFQKNLERSVTLMNGLRELVEYVRLRPVLVNQRVTTTEELDAVRKIATSASNTLDAERSSLTRVVGSKTAIDEGIQKLVANVTALDFARIGLRATSSTTYKARANWHISLDAGALVAVDIREVVPYLGVNWYLRPVNKDAPLSSKCWSRCFGRRFSFTLGVSATSVKQTNRVEDLVSGRAVLVGAGLRLTDYFRVTGGTLIVKTYVDGLDKRPRPHALPAAAASLDIDVINLLGKVGSALFP
jgi:hypothetical protein